MRRVGTFLGMAVALLAAPASEAQRLRVPVVQAPTPSPPPVVLPTGPRVPFSCGPRLFTYRVEGAEGIRCVELVDGGSFVWYGEGRTGAGFYRHIGYARVEGSAIVGFAADLYGSAGVTSGALDGTLSISAVPGAVGAPPPLIRVSGAWNEQWRLGAPDAPVATPEPPRGCGFAQPYQVHGASGRVPGEQCVLFARGQGVVWLAERVVDGHRRAHLGSARSGSVAAAFAPPGGSPLRWGATPICGGRYDACGATIAHGDLTMSPPGMRDGATIPTVQVNGAWRETWEPVLGDVQQPPPPELVVPRP